MDWMWSVPMRSRVALLLTVVVVLAISMPTPIMAQVKEPTRVAPTLSPNGEGEILTGAWPRTMAVDSFNNLWVANGFDSTVMRIDEGTGKQLEAPFPAGTQPTAMVWLDATKTMWVASYDDAALIPIEIDQGKPITRAPIPLGDSRPVGMAISGGNIWVITQVRDSLISKDNLIRFDPASKKVLSRLTVGTFPTAIISSATDTIPDDSRLFVANGHDDSISVVNTRANNGSGEVIATVTEGVPAFPMSLAFDGQFVWIGGYLCLNNENDRCVDSKVARLNTQNGKAEIVPDTLPGRQVFVSFKQGHTFVANGHGEGIADTNVVTVAAQRRIVPPATNGRGSYYGAVVMTKRYVYVADWTNDRLLRFLAPGAIEIPPTSTASPPTVTPPPSPTPEPCNPDPKFPPRLAPGMVARVINDEFTDELNIRKEPNFDPNVRTGNLFALGEEFTVLEGPFPNNRAISNTNNASCFYKVKGIKREEFAGFVSEGGLESSGKDKRYFIEPVP
jgi:YVTN family beta-propeller protein